MSAQFNIILVVGATSGIGEAFARRYHAQGKTIIAAGRRLERLQSLENELPGLQTQQMDVEDIATLPSQVASVLHHHPNIDTIMVVAGKGSSPNFKDPSTSSPQAISSEVTTNVTAPMALAQLLVPHLLSLKRPTTFVTVSSGMGFIPHHLFPVYSSTKSAMHYFSVLLRAQLSGTNVRMMEVVPPYTDTDMHGGYRKTVEDLMQAGLKPMPLDEYMDTAMEGLKDENAKEVATGRSERGVAAWRGAFGPILEAIHVEG